GGAGLGSGGGGGRRGPASAARPPSRATATAALAAQPPLTMKKLCAWVFASGCGKRSTRNTSSSTMIPAHKIARAPLPALAELNLFLHSLCDFNGLSDKDRAAPQTDPRAKSRLLPRLPRQLPDRSRPRARPRLGSQSHSIRSRSSPPCLCRAEST